MSVKKEENGLASFRDSMRGEAALGGVWTSAKDGGRGWGVYGAGDGADADSLQLLECLTSSL